MKTLRPVVIGMIGAAAGILITKDNFIDWTSWIIFAGAFIASQWLKINPILVIILAGVTGYIIY
jgi:chromate transporter